MTGALIILCVTVVVGFILWVTHKPGEPINEPQKVSHGPECCGQHEVCEKFPPKPEAPAYYDDEELDRFRLTESYTAEDEEQFRDILYSLLPEDRVGWAQSLEQRGITMPPAIKDEWLSLMNEVS